MQWCKIHIEQEECSGVRSHAGHSVTCLQNYVHHGIGKDLLDALEAKFGKAGGALTYLQLVNMVKIQFTDSTELLPQIQQFQDNYNHITSNSHSRLSEDLATFMFCSSLPESYELTAWQCLKNIMVIANYKFNGHHCMSPPRRV